MVHVALDPGKQFTFSTSLIIAHLTAIGIYFLTKIQEALFNVGFDKHEH